MKVGHRTGEDWGADLDGETVRLGVIHRDQEHGGRLGLGGQLK